MTVTVVFGVGDETDVTIDGQEGADSCAIVGSAEFVAADIVCVETADTTYFNVFNAAIPIDVTIAANESGDSCAIGVNVVNVQPPPPGSGKGKYKVHPPHPGRNIKVSS